MPDPVSIAPHQALAATDQARARELALLAKKIRDQELQVAALRSRLDGMLFYWHEDGHPVAALAAPAGSAARPRIRRSTATGAPWPRADLLSAARCCWLASERLPRSFGPESVPAPQLRAARR